MGKIFNVGITLNRVIKRILNRFMYNVLQINLDEIQTKDVMFLFILSSMNLMLLISVLKVTQ